MNLEETMVDKSITRLKEIYEEVNYMSVSLADMGLTGISQSLDNAYICLKSARVQLERKVGSGHGTG